MTPFEAEKEEPYILTPEEERKVLEHAKKSAQEHLKWRMEGAGSSPEKIAEKMASINWDEQINRVEILKRANSSNNYDIWQAQQRENDRLAAEKSQKELSETWTATKIKELMIWTSKNEFGKDFIIHEHNKGLIAAVCYFLSRDPRFEEMRSDYSLKKGLLIRGISGLGKTYVVRCAAENKLNPVLFLSMLDITSDVHQYGEFFLNWGDRKVCFFDDVGTEQGEVVFFGTRINWFKEFIENYYSRNKVFNKLIISTNYSFKEIEEKYGFRVRSRS